MLRTKLKLHEVRSGPKYALTEGDRLQPIWMTDSSRYARQGYQDQFVANVRWIQQESGLGRRRVAERSLFAP